MGTLRPLLMGISLALLGTSANAQAEKEVQLDIESQVLVDALNEWAQASGYRLIGPSSATLHRLSPRLQGKFTPRGALGRLLEGTTLTYEFIDERTVAIQEQVPTRTSVGDPAPNTRALRLAAGGNANRPASPARASAKDIREDLEVVIVTAQKREERLENVPISIAVMRGDELDRSTVPGMSEALGRVPGVATSTWAQGGNSVAIRGVSAGIPVFNGSSPVAYYLDTVPFGFVKTAIAPDLSPYDLARVEVLRGPQGTLYGASAQNGVIRVLTEDAKSDALEFKARTSASATEGGGENYRGDVAINVPIVKDKLAARAVVGYQSLGGWIDKPGTKDANDSEISNFRLKVNATPTEQLSIDLSAWLSRADYGAPSLGDSNDRTNNLVDEPGSADYDAYSVKIGYAFPAFSVSSTTSYLDYESSTIFDTLPELGFSAQYQAVFPSEIVSQELIFTSTHEGPWRWTAGGMYRDAEDALVVDIAGVFVDPFHLGEHSKSFAAFGELSLLVLDGELELTGGLRYFEDELTSTEVSTGAGLPASGDYFQGKFDALSPRAVVGWHPNDQMTLYASYAEGFRSGWGQIPFVMSSGFPPVEPDTLKNYELGAKGSLFGGRANVETAVYFIDWQDVQQTLTVPWTAGLQITAGVNSGSASGIGVDFAMTTQPLDGLSLGLNFSWNDLSMDSNVISAGTVLFAKGERLNLSPEYTIGASADYGFALGRTGLEARLSASANYVSEQDLRTIVGSSPYIARGDAMSIVRTSFSIDTPNNWTVTLFADNLTNEDGSPVRQPYLGAPMPTRDARIRPRTVGAQLEYHF